MSASSNQVTTSQDGGYTLVELREEKTGSIAVIAPERGGLLLSFVCRGQELLYLDRATFLDPKANVRGGNPILFPICGQLENTAYTYQGVTYPMRNHGLVRTEAWEVAGAGLDEAGYPYLTMKLKSTEEMLASYPFSFELVFTYRLIEGELILEQSYSNLSEQAMPFYAGFHPYFQLQGESKALVYETDATRYLDYNDNEEKPFAVTVDLGPLVESVALLDAKTPRITFMEPGAAHKLVMDYSPELRYVVLWSVPGKPFVCVEPWMAKTGELNRQEEEELPFLGRGETLKLRLAIRLEKV